MAFNVGVVAISNAVICVPLTYIFILSDAVACVVSSANTKWYQAEKSLKTCVVLYCPLAVPSVK